MALMVTRCVGMRAPQVGHPYEERLHNHARTWLITAPTRHDYAWMEALINDNSWSDLQAQTEAFRRLSQGFADALDVATSGSDEATKLGPFCTLLPGVIKKCVEIAPRHVPVGKVDDMQYQMIDIFSRVVELVVALLANPANYVNRHYPSKPVHLEPLLRPSVNNLLQALSHCLDLENQFYKFRQQHSVQKEIVVHPSQLKNALKVTGCFVKVCGACDGKIFCYCSQTRAVSALGISCQHDCCTKLPVHQEQDVLLTYIAHLFGTSCYGNGFKYILDILQDSQIHIMSMMIIGFLVTPLALLKSMRWAEADTFLQELRQAYEDVAYKVFRHANVVRKQSWTSPLIEMLHQLHTAVCWGFGCVQVEIVGLACHLQIMMWSRWLRMNRYSDLCKEVGDATECSFRTPLSASVLLEDSISSWLVEEDLVMKLLTAKYDTHTEVITFVGKISKIGVLQEQHVQRLLQQHPAASYELIIATAVECVDMNAFSSGMLEHIFQWLNMLELQGSSSITGRRAMNILNKLVVVDKKKTLSHERLMDLFWKHARNSPTTDLAPCLIALAGYQLSLEDTAGTSSTSQALVMPRIEEETRFLTKCVEADRASDLFECTPDQIELYVHKARFWVEKELNLYCKIVPNMDPLLGFHMPLTREEISQECLGRLGLAQDLTSHIYKDSQSVLGSIMPSVMSPEIHTWRALKMEASLRLELGNQISEKRNNNLKAFEDMKERHHAELSQLFERCEEENTNIVKEALYLKAQVVAGVDKGKITKDITLSPQDILTRMLQTAENVVEEAVRTPTPECAICSMGFTPKRKRACFGPCGHARACIQCATREYKKRKYCPFCDKATDKPRTIPPKLYY